jgi:hypothetical protein
MKLVPQEYYTTLSARFRRNWKASLLLAVFLGLVFYSFPMVLSNAMYAPENVLPPLQDPTPIPKLSQPIPAVDRVTPPPPIPSDAIPSAIPNDPTVAPTIAAKAVVELPFAVNLSHRRDLRFDATQGSLILVYDVQWVPTLSALVAIIADRIVPDSRSPTRLGILGNALVFS